MKIRLKKSCSTEREDHEKINFFEELIVRTCPARKSLKSGCLEEISSEKRKFSSSPAF